MGRKEKRKKRCGRRKSANGIRKPDRRPLPPDRPPASRPRSGVVIILESGKTPTRVSLGGYSHLFIDQYRSFIRERKKRPVCAEIFLIKNAPGKTHVIMGMLAHIISPLPTHWGKGELCHNTLDLIEPAPPSESRKERAPTGSNSAD